jgi:tellurite resistance protein
VYATPIWGFSNVVGRVMELVAAVVWLALLLLYLSKGAKRLADDWRSQLFSPFIALAAIVPTLLAGGLCDVNLSVGRVLVIVTSSITIAIGGWLTGQWILNEIEDESIHPGYLLPTATGGLVGALAAADAHIPLLAEAWFGIGIFCYVLTGSVILNRLILRPRIIPGLTPIIALEVGPPAVAGVAYHAIHPGPVDAFGAALAGFSILMILVQLRLIPMYRRLSFSPGFWSFTFPTAAVALYVVQWLQIGNPGALVAFTAIVVGIATAIIAAVAGRSLLAISRHQFFPPAPAPATQTQTASS